MRVLLKVMANLAEPHGGAASTTGSSPRCPGWPHRPERTALGLHVRDVSGAVEARGAPTPTHRSTPDARVDRAERTTSGTLRAGRRTYRDVSTATERGACRDDQPLPADPVLLRLRHRRSPPLSVLGSTRSSAQAATTASSSTPTSAASSPRRRRPRRPRPGEVLHDGDALHHLRHRVGLPLPVRGRLRPARALRAGGDGALRGRRVFIAYAYVWRRGGLEWD